MKTILLMVGEYVGRFLFTGGYHASRAAVLRNGFNVKTRETAWTVYVVTRKGRRRVSQLYFRGVRVCHIQLT